jgi:uncharacterized cupredoxin-like copper-binding protein
MLRRLHDGFHHLTLKDRIMKTMIMAVAFLAALAAGIPSVSAQQKKTMTAQDLTQTLTNTTTQNGLINVGGVSVPVSNVTVQDLVTVQNVLNNAEINVLNNSLNNNEVLKNVTVNLTNLLRDAKILNKNQVIVGVLSDQDRIRFITQNARSRR